MVIDGCLDLTLLGADDHQFPVENETQRRRHRLLARLDGRQDQA